MVLDVADLVLYPAFLGSLVLLVLYGVAQPWWKSVFGISYVLILLMLLLALGRSVLTDLLGEHYQGRNVLALVCLIAVTLATWASVIMLSVRLYCDWKKAGKASRPISRPQTPSDVP